MANHAVFQTCRPMTWSLRPPHSSQLSLPNLTILPMAVPSTKSHKVTSIFSILLYLVTCLWRCQNFLSFSKVHRGKSKLLAFRCQYVDQWVRLLPVHAGILQSCNIAILLYFSRRPPCKPAAKLQFAFICYAFASFKRGVVL